MKIKTLLTPFLLPTDNLSKTIAVIFDVFFATTSVNIIFERGGEKITPVSSERELIGKLKSSANANTPLILEKSFKDNFSHLSANRKTYSTRPSELSAANFSSASHYLMLTQNGTSAMNMAANADVKLLACLNNLDCVANEICQQQPDVLHIMCSGSNGRPSLEDTWSAGLMAKCIVRNIESRGRIHESPSLCQATKKAIELNNSLSSQQVATASPTGRYILSQGDVSSVRLAMSLNTSTSIQCLNLMGQIVSI